MQYRCVASSPEGLVQQVAVSYLRHGYWFYVSGWIKRGKDLEAVDRKLIDKYQIAISERERSARKQRGVANLQYIRYRNFFLLLATEGHHPFKQQERNQIRDCRRVPIKFEGYSISYRQSGVTPKGGGPPKWHACVRIDPPTYKQLKAFFRDRACHRSGENLAADFARVPFARYAPVRRQLLTILRSVNEARARVGYEPLAYSVLLLRRRIVMPFVAPAALGGEELSVEVGVEGPDRASGEHGAETRHQGLRERDGNLEETAARETKLHRAASTRPMRRPP